MSSVVEDVKRHPTVTVVETGDGRVTQVTEEGEWAAPGRLTTRLRDDPTVDEGDCARASWDTARHRCKSRSDTRRERRCRFRADAYVPSLPSENFSHRGVAKLGGSEVPLEVSQVHLAERGDDLGHVPAGICKWSSSLESPPQGCDKDALDALRGQACGSQCRLLEPMGRERRVALTAD
jgi:hypothetical protein